jgi:hypothetical protein
MIGLDLAKNVLQAHGADAAGAPARSHELSALWPMMTARSAASSAIISFSVTPLRFVISPTMKVSCATSRETRRRPCSRAVVSPSLARAIQRIAVEMPTPNRAAVCRADKPPVEAFKTRKRRSSLSARAMAGLAIPASVALRGPKARADVGEVITPVHSSFWRLVNLIGGRITAIVLTCIAILALMWTRSMPSLRLLLILCSAPLASFAAEPSDAFFLSRPAFSRPEVSASKAATCDTLASQLPAPREEPPEEERVDLAITGRVSLVQTDGVLWYVAVCADPGVRVLCVAYDANGLKVGDIAALRGAYSRRGPRHVSLDPCLASPPE